MGLRGPAPKPRALVELEGNPGKRPLNPREPQPAVKRPRCPAYLDDNAKREWRRLTPVLERMRVLTEADEIALASLCQQYALLQEAQIKLKKTGLLIKTRSGYIQQSPLVAIISATVDQVIKLSREFGLTPSSRTRIQVEPAESSSQSLQRAIMRFARPPCADGDTPPRTPSVSSPPAGSGIN